MLLEEKVEKIHQELAEGKKVERLSTDEVKSIESMVELLDQGKLRVATKIGDYWKTNEWIKKGILIYFRLRKMSLMEAGDFNFWDKIPTKKWTGEEGVRVVPPAFVRYGAAVQPGAILMPSYVNIGAYVDSGTMVDTWATVGSCAQIGKNVHLSGGVGIGGVLEPIQAQPVIIADSVFVGSRCIIVEGVRVQEGAVLGAGTVLTASTRIIDVTQSSPLEIRGRVPRNAVVIPGTIPKKFPAGEFGVPCALIIGERKPSTDLKVSLTDALREFQVSV